MANRDMNSVKRDMQECIKHIASCFKDAEVKLEAGPVAQLAEVMFNDYRGNSTRDIIEQTTAAEKELLTMEHELNADTSGI